MKIEGYVRLVIRRARSVLSSMTMIVNGYGVYPSSGKLFSNTFARRASRNYIIALEERIKSLEGSIKHAVPNSPNERSRPTERNPESGIGNSPLDAQNAYNQQAQTPLAERDVTYQANGRRWSHESSRGIVTTPISAENLPLYEGTIPLAPAPASALLQTNRQIISTYSDTNWPAISQISTPLSKNSISHPLRPWEDEPQISTRSQLQSSQGDRSEGFNTRGAVEAAVLHSTPSAKSVESPARVRATSPSYEDDRQVKPKVRLRCFGPTCPLHVLLRPTPQDPISTAKSPDSYLPSMDSEQFQRELLNIYWEFQPFSVIIVHKETFMEHFSLGTPSEYYSEFLLNCILACAVRLSTRVAIRSLSSLYIKRAKMNLVDDLERAIIATLQGFCLLSEFEMSSGRDQSGWLYAGMSYIVP